MQKLSLRFGKIELKREAATTYMRFFGVLEESSLTKTSREEQNACAKRKERGDSIAFVMLMNSLKTKTGIQKRWKWILSLT